MPATPAQFRRYKQQGRPIVALTAWDYTLARLLEQAGVDLILVGDSLAMVALGHPTTLPVTLDEMIHHAKAVRRGAPNAFLVMDLPFLSYQESLAQAIHAAGLALKEAGVQAVKVEGGYDRILDAIRHLAEMGIPVMGHVGLTPQSVNQLGYRQQGRAPDRADRILAEAIALEQAGVFALVLEHIPDELAAEITRHLQIPTIGIGAGGHCDGQVLVTADLLGLSAQSPPFARRYLDLASLIVSAVQQFASDVQARQFPAHQGESARS